MLLDNNICSSKHVLSAISSLSNRAPLGALENRTKTQNAPIVHIQAAKGARLLKLDMALQTCFELLYCYPTSFLFSFGFCLCRLATTRMMK